MGLPVALGVMIAPTATDLMDSAYVRNLASLLEKEECESVWVGDHPALVKDRHHTGNDGCFPSPLEWLTFVAAHTTSLKLGVAVLVVPFQHPVVLAKRVATLDRLSNGRTVIGVGLGNQIEEAKALEADIDRRSAIMTESIEVMRAIWTATDRASFDGRLFSFRNVDPTPHPAQPLGPPILIGGSSLAAARRAGRLGHGLIVLDGEPERAQQLIDLARTEAIHGGWDAASIELTVQFVEDPSKLRLMLAAGASRLILRAPASGDLGELREVIGTAKRLLAGVA
jgi:probable F420-dependent oxidoreductase